MAEYAIIGIIKQFGIILIDLVACDATFHTTYVRLTYSMNLGPLYTKGREPWTREYKL